MLTLDEFVRVHRNQLDQLQIPETLFNGIQKQLEVTFAMCEDGVCLDTSQLSNPDRILNAEWTTKHGAILVLPHVISWDMLRGQGLVEALQEAEGTNREVLQALWQNLQMLRAAESCSAKGDWPVDEYSSLVDAIADHPAVWSRVILYRSSAGAVRAALHGPPYLPQAENGRDSDCTGPIPFVYHHAASNSAIDVSLLYVSPEYAEAFRTKAGSNGRGIKDWRPTIDLAPAYQVASERARYVRYAALLNGTKEHNVLAAQVVTEIYKQFVREMQLVRDIALLRRQQPEELTTAPTIDMPSQMNGNTLYRVYTDTDDPMKLKDPECGLEANSPHFVLVDTLEEADIVYSFTSAFAPNSPIFNHLKQSANKNVMINQFPYEGAFVQKDHLARELLKQHGLPRPLWSLETYDLDVHLAEFVGAVLNDDDPNKGSSDKPPLWIIKPAHGTQSKGHVVTRSLAHVIRLLDAVSGRRVAQRYIERPVCLNGHKVDCRCLVLMMPSRATCESPAAHLPILYMHQTLYFRVAHKPHQIATARDLTDHESVLTATHILDANNRSSKDELRKLPAYHETIARLEAQYPNNAFDWNGKLLPQIQTMIRELFNGMTLAYPAMMESKTSRALYGVDVMFQLDGTNDGGIVVTPKLTEVTFCPANNAICEAYVQDDDVTRSFNKDVFECLFLGLESPNLQRLQ
jgi:Tubulin-tyrosine ligase family